MTSWHTMITPFYTAILGIIYVALSFRTLLLRRGADVPIGDGGNIQLHRAIRAHANFAEYTPITVLLMFFVEMRTGVDMGIHVMWVAFIAGRLVHAYGVSQIDEDYHLRVFAIVLTLGTIISASARLLAS